MVVRPLSLPDELTEQLLGSIIDGTYPPGTALPSESEIAELFSVSRLTVRESVKALRAQRVVRVERGFGTYVNDPDRWTSLEPLIRATTARAPANDGLLEVRRLLLTAAAELAAGNRTDRDLAGLRAHLTAMREAADPDDFRAATGDFHRALVRATGNAYLPLVFEPFAPITAEDDLLRARGALAAVERGDAARAREAMNRPASQAVPEQSA
ncbi:FadR/GntR family transcriptional regulator [Saccharopolyspora griseoalba]|uniref:FadR/GntR family transcriptional regulator n=1 Tax=Saccharopolyspora griseoalba TaxID=1431848 RepID=A0ABW2LC20_9PSEU